MPANEPKPRPTTLDVIAIGEPLYELNQPRGATHFLQGFGGDTSNAMIAAARCGARSGYFCAIGADRFGEALIELWGREGVDCGRVMVNGGAHTGLYFVTHGARGHEFSYMRAGSAASRIGPSDVPRDAIASARALHVSGISQAISASAADAVFAAIDIARGAGALVSYDTNLRLALWPLPRARAIIHDAISRADIALPGLDDARLLTGLDDADAIADFYLRLGVRIVAMTLGAEGALIATAGKRARIPSLKVDAVDATGAGDAFDGAFLAAYLRDGDPFAAGRYAVAGASLSTLGYGAIAPLPTHERILAAMRETGR
jgi:2-dehydro-3-deoxygluconokinase